MSGKEVTIVERLARWSASIPEELHPPADGSPRSRILGAAAEHFAERGFTQSTTRAIAESAGVNQAMIHYYFQSKTRLYERVLAGMVVDLLSSLASSLGPKSASPVDALVEFPERIIGLFASDPVRVAILRREIGNGAPSLRAVVDQLGASGPRGFSAIMIDFIESACRSEELAKDPPTAILEFLLVHAYGALLIEPMLQHLFASRNTRKNMEKLVRSQRGLLRRALTARAKEDDTT